MEGQISGKFGFRVVGNMGKLLHQGMSFSMKKRADNWRRKFQQQNRLFSTKSVSSKDLPISIQLHLPRFDQRHHLQAPSPPPSPPPSPSVSSDEDDDLPPPAKTTAKQRPAPPAPTRISSREGKGQHQPRYGESVTAKLANANSDDEAELA